MSEIIAKDSCSSTALQVIFEVACLVLRMPRRETLAEVSCPC